MLGGRPARLPRLRSRTKPRKAWPVRELTRVAVPLHPDRARLATFFTIPANWPAGCEKIQPAGQDVSGV